LSRIALEEIRNGAYQRFVLAHDFSDKRY